MRLSKTLFFATLLASALSACARKEQAPSTSGAAASASTAATPAGPKVVTVHAKDFSYDAPAEIDAGLTTFKLVNDGTMFHHLVIVKLDSAKTVADLQQAMKNPGPPPRWAAFIGGPNAPDPTKESNATLDMQPGSYAMLCLVDVPGGVPHFAKGMVHALTVKPSSGASAQAPSADVNISLKDYSFDISKPITAGSHTFAVNNAGMQPHEVEVIKLAPGKKIDDVVKWIQKPEGPPPGSGVGGAIVGMTGAPLFFTMDFTPGEYALICFIPDAKDGKPHFVHGMMHTFTVS